MLSKPILALTRDRSKKAQINDFCGDPAEWFDTEYFREHNLNATSFDFFVDWEKEIVCDEIWIKRISDSEQIQEQNEKELMDLISLCDGKENANRLYSFLSYQRMIEKYMLFRDVPEEYWENGDEKVVELDLSRYTSSRSLISHFNAEEIQEKIRELRKRPASIGEAGLNYSTSYLEGYLSRKPFFWPGDVDTLLYDDNNKVIAVVEFKKHTASSKIPFASQGITNYLKKDILKYKSLALLRDKFETDLFVLYYPIPSNIKYVIIEKIEGNPDSLHASRRIELDLPNRRLSDSMKNFAERFITDVLNR